LAGPGSAARPRRLQGGEPLRTGSLANFEVDCAAEVTSMRYTQTVLRNGAVATASTKGA